MTELRSQIDTLQDVYLGQQKLIESLRRQLDQAKDYPEIKTELG